MYGLVADRLKFDPASHEAETSGRAEVSLQGGVALRAAGFKFGGTGRLLQSQGPATFAGPGWGGLAGGARCSLEKDTIELTGGTSVSWRGSGAGCRAVVDPARAAPPVRPQGGHDRVPRRPHRPAGPDAGAHGARRAPALRARGRAPRGDARAARCASTGCSTTAATWTRPPGTTVIESLPAGRYRLTAEPGGRRPAGFRSSGPTAPRGGATSPRGASSARGREPRGSGWRARASRAPATSRRTRIPAAWPPTGCGSSSTRGRPRRSWRPIASASRPATSGPTGANCSSRSQRGRSSCAPRRGSAWRWERPAPRSWCDRLEGAEGGNVVARGQVTGALERAGGAGEDRHPGAVRGRLRDRIRRRGAPDPGRRRPALAGGPSGPCRPARVRPRRRRRHRRGRAS